MPFWKKRQEKKTPPPAQAAEPVGRTLAPEPAQPVSAPPKRLLSYRIGNMQGVGSRARQEDSFTFMNALDVTEMRRNGLLAVVADGMGGMEGGKTASEAVIATLREDFPNMDRNGDLAAQLRESAFRAGDRVLSILGGIGGSTLVACIFYEEQLWFVSIGDSSLFLLRDGQLLRLNREHNVLQDRYLDTVRAHSMDPAPARADPEKNALTQFLGMDGLSDADVLRRPLKLKHGDRFLLCSDGVADMVPEDVLTASLMMDVPEETCAALEQAVLLANNPYQDNYTALVVQCGY